MTPPSDAPVRPWTGLLLLLAILALAGCISQTEDARYPPRGSDEAAITDCAGADVVHGIDVSEWQGSAIDWDAVRADGYDFAFIRVSYGLHHPDGDFAGNWQRAGDAGVIRGAYQYFRPSQDAVAQAQLLIDAMGPLLPGDLPPVIDVETTEGFGPSAMAAKVGAWIDHVEAELGVTPIVYTGKYFWQDHVGSTAYADHPLWLPYYFGNYEYNCPSTPDQWSSWTFWQWTDSGSVAGIPGPVDRNVFDGTLADLQAMTVGGGGACGDGTCGGDETHQGCPADCVSLTLIAPQDGDVAANPVTFRASAAPTVAQVRYDADGYDLGGSLDPASGFEVTYTFDTLGVRAITATGYDAAGDRITATEATVEVVEHTGATLAFAEPLDGAVVPNPVTFGVVASPDIAYVRYVADVWEFGDSADPASGFEVTYPFQTVGARHVVAHGFDAQDTLVATASIDIEVTDPGVPWLSITEPSDGATVVNPVTFRVAASADVAYVRYVADVWEFGDSADPASGFEVTYDFNSLGTREIHALGFDASDQQVAEDVITVDVVAPGLAIATPGDGDGVDNPVTFRVFASPDIVHVRYVADIWEFGDSWDAASDFEVTYSFLTEGLRTIVAEGYDAADQLVDSDSIQITVGGDVWLAVPYFHQYDNAYEPGTTCGITSAAMLLDHWHPGSVTPDSLYLTYGKAQGQSPPGLQQLYEWEGLFARSTYSGTRQQVRDMLDAGRPVVAHGTFTPSGHIVAIVGHDDQGWIVHDPAGDWYQCYGCGVSGEGVHYPYGGGADDALGADGTLWISTADEVWFSW